SSRDDSYRSRNFRDARDDCEQSSRDERRSSLDNKDRRESSQRKREERERNRNRNRIDNRSKDDYYRSANRSENRDYRYKKQCFITEIKINDKKNIFRAYNVEHATKDKDISSASNSYENNYSNEIVEKNFEN